MAAPKVYQIAEFDNDHYYFDIVDNVGCEKDWMTIMKDNGAIGIINLGYFGLSAPHGYASGCKIHGTWMCKQTYTAYGICIDKDGKAFVGTGEEENAYSYAEALPIFMKDGKLCNTNQEWSANGTTTLGFKNGNLVCMICDKDNKQTSAEQIDAMTEYGCTDILRMDGSWSSQGRLGFGKVVQPSQMRRDRCYLLIFEKEAITPMNAKKVTIDPYAVSDAVKYKDTFDFCDEVKEALAYEGIEGMLSCYRDNPELDSSVRAKQSNEWGADLVICLSANASGGVDGLTAAWTDKTTSAAYQFALSILNLMKENGMNVPSIPAVLSTDPMLVETNACASMAAFVGDMSSKENRYKPLCIITEAICNKLGVGYKQPPMNTDESTDSEDTTTDESTTTETPETPSTDPDVSTDSIEYPESTKENFAKLQELGVFEKTVSMGEVIHYSDLANILVNVIGICTRKEDTSTDNYPDMDNSSDSVSNSSIDEDALKTLIINTMNDVLNKTGISDEAIIDKVRNAVDDYIENTYNLDRKIADALKACFEAITTALSNIEDK